LFLLVGLVVYSSTKSPQLKEIILKNKTMKKTMNPIFPESTPPKKRVALATYTMRERNVSV